MIKQLLVFVLICCYFINQGVAQDFALAKEQNGVKVFTRKVEGWGIKEYKVTMTVKAPLSKVVSVLKDASARYSWAHNTIEVREVERPNKDVVIIYNKIDAPWPVSDRDNITQFSFSYPSSTTARIDMKIHKTHSKAPVYSGVVRINRMEGHWILKDNGNGTVDLMQQCVADPGGSIPDWLANSVVVDNPYNSMYKLKKYIEG